MGEVAARKQSAFHQGNFRDAESCVHTVFRLGIQKEIRDASEKFQAAYQSLKIRKRAGSYS